MRETALVRTRCQPHARAVLAQRSIPDVRRRHASVRGAVLVAALAMAPCAHAGVLDTITAGLGKVTDAVSSIYHAGATKVSDFLAGRQADRLPQTMQLLVQSQSSVQDKQQQLQSYASAASGQSDATRQYVRERENDLLTAQQQNSSLYQQFRQTVLDMQSKGQDVSAMAGQIDAIETAQRQIEGNYQTLSQAYGRFWEAAPSAGGSAGASTQGAGATGSGSGADGAPASGASGASGATGQSATSSAGSTGSTGSTGSAGGDGQDIASSSSAPAGTGATDGSAAASGATTGGPVSLSGAAGQGAGAPASGVTTGSAGGSVITTPGSVQAGAQDQASPWATPRGQAAIDEWLSRAGLDPWGRMVNGTTLQGAGNADAGSRSRYRYVWDALADDAAGSSMTLRTFVTARLRGENPTVRPAPRPSASALGQSTAASLSSGSSSGSPGVPAAPTSASGDPGVVAGPSDAQAGYQQAVGELQAIIANPASTPEQKAAAYQKLLSATTARDAAMSSSR